MIVSISYCICLDLAIFQSDTLADLLHIVSSEVLVEVYVIYLLLQELRVSQLRSQVTIVGQQENTCCVTVETTYWVDTLRAYILHEVHHSLALLRIIAGCHVILWLVEQYIYLLLQRYHCIVELHLVGAKNLGTQLGNYLTIDSYQTSLDELISLTARAYTSIGKELVQAQWLCWVDILLLVLDALLHAILSIWIVSRSVLAEAATTVVVIATTTIVAIATATVVTVIATTTVVAIATATVVAVIATTAVVAVTTATVAVVATTLWTAVATLLTWLVTTIRLMLVVTFCIIVETRTAIVTTLLRTAVVATLLWTAITTATVVAIAATTAVAIVATLLWTAIATTAATIAAALWALAARAALQASSESFWTEATLAAVTTSIATIRWAMTTDTWALWATYTTITLLITACVEALSGVLALRRLTLWFVLEL